MTTITTQPSPVWRLFAAGIKRGAGPLLVEQPDLITGDELLHRIKMDIWSVEGGEYASDFAVAELMTMGLRAVAVFASVTGHEYSGDWSARNTYPASLADAAASYVRRPAMTS